jgi:hypothetical protein
MQSKYENDAIVNSPLSVKSQSKEEWAVSYVQRYGRNAVKNGLAYLLYPDFPDEGFA